MPAQEGGDSLQSAEGGISLVYMKSQEMMYHRGVGEGARSDLDGKRHCAGAMSSRRLPVLVFNARLQLGKRGLEECKLGSCSDIACISLP